MVTLVAPKISAPEADSSIRDFRLVDMYSTNQIVRNRTRGKVKSACVCIKR